MSASHTLRTRRRSFANLGGYSAIAQRWGLGLCGCGSWVDRRGQVRYRDGDHNAGWTAYRMKAIHWRDRPVTRRGLYQFHKLIAVSLYRDAAIGERGLRIYHQNVYASQLALAVRIRFPREFAERDRARVRLWLAIARHSGEFPQSREFIRRVKAWAR